MNEINNVVVIGSGQMGNGIGQVALMAGFHVTMVDIKEEFVDRGYENIENGMKKLETKGALGEGMTAIDIMARCKKSIDIASAMKNADLMVEAVVEDMDVKKDIFKICGENSPEHCILASNTSTMSITEMGKASGRPEKCIGLHFFNPVPLMRLIEVIYSEDSSDESIELGMKFSQELPCLRGERYIAKVLKDRPGFLVNRITAPVQIYQNYVFDLCNERGISWDALDNDTVGPMAVTVLADFTGIDTMYHGQQYYAKKLSPDFAPGNVVSQLFDEGKFGAKTGRGFHDWSKGRPQPNKSAGKAKIYDLKYPIAIMINEGCRTLEEGITKSWKVIDDSLMAGFNMPPPMAPNVNNSAKQVDTLNELVDITGKEYFKPCDLLRSGKWVDMK